MSVDDPRNPAPTSALDRVVRRFHRASYAAAVAALYGIAIIGVGLSLAPALWLVRAWGPTLWRSAAWWALPTLGVLLAAGLFLSGFTLLVVVPVLNAVLPTRIRPFKGGYFTLAAVPWYVHNGLFYLARFTMLPFVTLTPIGIWFLRAMGMHMGRRPRIATEYFTDVSMITLGDDVVIGGSAQLFAHYGGGGHLVLAPVRIGHRATIGEKATVMGDVVVGDDAIVLAHSVLLPGTRVGAGERWGGVPARRIEDAEWDAYRATTGHGTAHSSNRPTG